MNWTKKITAAACATLMVAGLAGCNTGADTNWIAKIGDRTIPAGVYLGMMMDQYYTQSTKLTKDGAEMPKKPLDAMVDGVKVSDLMTQGARKDLDLFLASEAKFDEMGLSVEAEKQALIEQEIASYWTYLQGAYQENGVSEQSYTMLEMNRYKKDELFTKIYGEGGSEEVPMSEISEKFAKDYAKLLVIPLRFSDSEDAAEKESADKTTREAIEKYKKMVEDGQDMEDVVFEARKETAEDPATLTQPEKGTSFTFVNRDQPTYEDNVMEAIFAAEIGKPFTVETEGSAYLFMRYASDEKAEDVEKFRTSIAFQLRKDAFDEKLVQWASELSATVNDAAIKRYTPSKIKV